MYAYASVDIKILFFFFLKKMGDDVKVVNTPLTYHNCLHLTCLSHNQVCHHTPDWDVSMNEIRYTQSTSDHNGDDLHSCK